ncbi:hypothetical protein [Rhodoblastus sphagnicola]|uniref:hypothetical protein n=1 Tax=Rhodoblastus sphagnicola TaxID=333368 RepID=UPI001304EE83|nr:hypothetical protein [Rhodoblastus sphagnicola]
MAAGKLHYPTPHDAWGKGVVHAIKWAVQRSRYMTVESVAPLSVDPLVSLPAVAG